MVYSFAVSEFLPELIVDKTLHSVIFINDEVVNILPAWLIWFSSKRYFVVLNRLYKLEKPVFAFDEISLHNVLQRLTALLRRLVNFNFVEGHEFFGWACEVVGSVKIVKLTDPLFVYWGGAHSFLLHNKTLVFLFEAGCLKLKQAQPHILALFLLPLGVQNCQAIAIGSYLFLFLISFFPGFFFFLLPHHSQLKWLGNNFTTSGLNSCIFSYFYSVWPCNWIVLLG